jgi:hypothetical protein
MESNGEEDENRGIQDPGEDEGDAAGPDGAIVFHVGLLFGE